MAELASSPQHNFHRLPLLRLHMGNFMLDTIHVWVYIYQCSLIAEYRR